MKKSELVKMVEELSIDPIWKCYTRAALQLRWTEFSKNAVGIAYCDIDDMHGLNAKYGHGGTDAKIMSVINKVRCDDIVSSRWLNGDELVFILKSGEAEAFCHRIQAEFNEMGIQGTFSFSNWILDDPNATIDPLDAKVQARKNKGIKGVVLS